MIVHTGLRGLPENACDFLQHMGLPTSRNFIHYVHNCIFRAQQPPVDTQFRNVTFPWKLDHQPPSSAPLYVNHYFASTCKHFKKKAKVRLDWWRARHGSELPQTWFQARVGIGLGDSSAEICKSLLEGFTVNDTTMAGLAWQVSLVMKARSSKVLPEPPSRPGCSKCHHLANCVDVLGKRGECVCQEGYYGNGSVCGTVRWPSAEFAGGAEHDYLASPPNGDLSPSVWSTRKVITGKAGFAKIVVKFEPPVASPRKLLLYRPFGGWALDTIAVIDVEKETSTTIWKSATSRKAEEQKERWIEIPLKNMPHTVRALKIRVWGGGDRRNITIKGIGLLGKAAEAA